MWYIFQLVFKSSLPRKVCKVMESDRISFVGGYIVD